MCPKPRLTLWPDLGGLGLGPLSKWPTNAWMQFCWEVQESWVYRTKMIQQGLQSVAACWCHLGSLETEECGCLASGLCLNLSKVDPAWELVSCFPRYSKEHAGQSAIVQCSGSQVHLHHNHLLKHRLLDPVSREFDPICEFVFLTSFWVTLMRWSGVHPLRTMDAMGWDFKADILEHMWAEL